MRRRTVLRSLGVALVGAGAGCSGTDSTTDASPTLPSTPPEVASADGSTPTDSPTATSTSTTEGTTATVTRIVDGDTVEARIDGQQETLRLLGVDTPETHVDVSPAEYEGIPDTPTARACLRRYGDRATAFTRERLLGETVRLQFDPNEGRRGSYGRLLVYVSVDGAPFNIQLIRQGYARVFDSEFARRARFYDVEAEAQAAGRGVWSCREATPTPTDSGGGGAGSGSLVVADVHADADGNDHENLTDEYVVFANTGADPLDMSGWTVRDAADHEYVVPTGFTLGSGDQVTLYTGSGSDSATDLYWGAESAVWNNGGDTIVVTDEEGAVVLEYRY